MRIWGLMLGVLVGGGVGSLHMGILAMVTGNESGGAPAFVIGLLAVILLPLLFGIVATAGGKGDSKAVVSAFRVHRDGVIDPSWPRHLARVESLEERGLTMNKTDHLYDFTLTVFPRAGRASLVTTSAFVTLADLANVAVGRYVIVADDPASPGARRINLHPAASWASMLRDAPERYDAHRAPSPAPSSPGSSRSAP